MTNRVKRAVRHVADRVMLPYVDQVESRLAGASAPSERSAIVSPEGGTDLPSSGDTSPDGVPSDRFQALNHALRTVALEAAPKGARRVASIGAAGRWYFDWFEQSVGPVDLHLGVEAFEPQPPDLPDYVRWVTNTADHLDSLGDGSVDMVYAGQTTEHLWAHELAGFLIEAHRVLPVGGHLVVDSPNRAVTESLNWSHGGHTVELTAGEFADLVGLAGFHVTRCEGMWRCRFGETVLQLDEAMGDDAMTVRRITTAAERPDDSFIWWIEAERLDGTPDALAVARRIDEIYAAAWSTRVCRGMWEGPEPGTLKIRAGTTGRVAASLPFPLHDADWSLRCSLQTGELADLGGLAIRVTAPDGTVFHDLRAEDAAHTSDGLCWSFHQPWFCLALSLEIHVDAARSDVELAMPLQLEVISP